MILTNVPSVKYAVIQEVTARDNNLLTISTLCELAGVSRSGYYKWVGNENIRKQQQADDEHDFSLILEAYKFRGYAKGQRGIHMRLLHMNPPVVMNRKKIARLMNKFNLFCPQRKPNAYRQLEKRLRTAMVQPNLLNRQFRAFGPRMVLLTDITYIPRGEGKFTYLSVVMDAYTKQVLGYAYSWSLEVDFVLETVEMVMKNHGIELKTDVLIHSDQGCHYTSHKFADILKNYELRHSMSRRANCWDNAPQENFFGHMKDDISFRHGASHADVATKIDDWIGYYNADRPQWALAKLSPNEFYAYYTTGVYPLAVPPPLDAVKPPGGSAPEPPEFIASVSGKGDNTGQRSVADDADQKTFANDKGVCTFF
jgi:transposase InsO family protein